MLFENLTIKALRHLLLVSVSENRSIYHC